MLDVKLPDQQAKPNETKLPKIITRANVNNSPLSNELKAQNSKPSLSKQNSQNRLLTLVKSKPVKAKQNTPFAQLAAASFDEMNRLTSLIKEQSTTITNLNKEIKTLRILLGRQDRALNMHEKEKADFPQILRSMSEEIRVLRAEKHKYCEKISSIERQYLSQNEEIVRLQDKANSLQSKLKSHEHVELETVQKQSTRLSLQKQQLENEIENLQKQVRQAQLECSREVTFAKNQSSKVSKQLEEANEEIVQLKSRLKERDRQVNALSIYSAQSDNESMSSIRQKARKTSKKYNPAHPTIQEENCDIEYPEAPVVTVKLETENVVPDEIAKNVVPDETEKNVKNETSQVEQPLNFYKPAIKTNKPNIDDPSRTTLGSDKTDSIASAYTDDFE